ncbi:AsmA family protein [Thermodesulfobacteriota bacterium]
MKKTIKWFAIIVGGLVVLVIAALIIIPMVYDVQKFKPEIENLVKDSTGRPFAIDGELKLSLFPWVGLAFSDLHFGNPPGFKEKEFISVKSFEVKVKFIPLLMGIAKSEITEEIEVKKFIVEEPRIVLIKDRNGKANWENIGKPKSPKPEKETVEKKGTSTKEKGLNVKSIFVDELAIQNASIVFVDQSKAERKEISELNLLLDDVSLDKPLKISFSANIDGNPLSLDGKVGPLGKEPGKGTIPLDLIIKALKEINMAIKGTVTGPQANLKYDLSLEVSPFSLRKVFDRLGKKFPVSTSDPDSLTHIALKADMKGTKNQVSISDGKIELDDSKMDFGIKAGDFNKPDVNFNMNLDKIDVDRYLPAKGDKKEAKAKKEKISKTKTAKTDYGPLRKLVLNGDVQISEMKISGAKVQNVKLKVTGKNGIFHLDPLTMNLYDGNMKAKGNMNVTQDTPRSIMDMHAEGIKIGPLLKDVLKKDIIEGTFKTDLNISMSGDNADAIKKTLNGKGEMLMKDGALIGIDLDAMIRNVKAAFGAAERKESTARTDFSEIKSVFTITNGLFNTKDTTLTSPVLRVFAEGDANLVTEALDMRIEPKFVGTIKGQGDTEKRKGIVVPIKVTGTFLDPKYTPDLEGTIKKGLKETLSDPEKLKKIFDSKDGKGRKKDLKEVGKDLLKGFITDE